MFKCSSGEVKKRKPRTSFDEKDKLIFLLRTVMSENQFGVWKKRFPILKGLRTRFELSQKIVVATAIRFNFGRMLNDDPLEDDDEEESDHDSHTEEYRNLKIEEMASNHCPIRAFVVGHMPTNGQQM